MQPYQPDAPLVSFVVPAYNTEKFLADCVDSILKQEGNYDFEIVIVDDASTDGTEKVARSYTDKRIRYIRHATNQGAFVTINEAFENARGKFIARIDSDDRYRPNFLALTLPILQQNPEVGMVYGDIAMIDANGTIMTHGGHVQRGDRPVKGNELIPLLEKNYVPAPTVIARREAWADALPIPHGFSFCDWFLSVGIAKKWEFFYIDQVLADYRIHTQNMHHTMIFDKTGERITMQILDQVFGEPDRQQEKRKVKRRVYAKNYLILADKYFGCQMNADARRCYLAALRYKPTYFANIGLMRRLLGTLIGPQTYELSKTVLKRVWSS
jgi:glycosyltransferase involved in cell wall biosynthesis